ncbi:hypothetical protein FDP41_007450 [Naegleria fowleri]|uniref:Uncharacterized protein n=1 Tax=Naegleria fowleri TaxID=5763 RepID=A0A6A5C1G7_NAEFO|nr:uncharacterized protein FDP41_007450 [Naegleria fowleri]KAF0984273.1 hypothetical protein FDP41_007450 [Naegleria fowleri]CAG4707799.1 unnamed protein product [Naegleria fowleri]
MATTNTNNNADSTLCIHHHQNSTSSSQLHHCHHEQKSHSQVTTSTDKQFNNVTSAITTSNAIQDENSHHNFDWDAQTEEWNINQYGSNLDERSSPDRPVERHARSSPNVSSCIESPCSPIENSRRRLIEKQNKMKLSRKHEKTKIINKIKSFYEIGEWDEDDQDYDDFSEEEQPSNNVQDRSRMMINEVDELIERLLEIKRNLERNCK